MSDRLHRGTVFTLAIVGLVVGLLLGYSLGQRPAPANDEASADRATVDALKAQVASQATQLEQLQAAKKALEQELQSAKMAPTRKMAPPPVPAPTPTVTAPSVTQPAKSKAAEEVRSESKPSLEDVSDAFETLAGMGLKAFRSPKYAEFLKQVRTAGPEGVALLVQGLDAKNTAEARLLASNLLGKLGDAAAVPGLSKSLESDTDLMVRRSAAKALADIGADSALNPLRAAMSDDKDWGVRVNSSYALAKMGDEEGLKYLTQAYFSEDTPTEYLLPILGGLADVAAPSTAATFRRILADTKDESYLLVSIGALAKMKDMGAIAALEGIAGSDLPATVKNAARRAIDTILAPSKK